ncbi:MAG: phytoene desaturase family protein, partial [Haloglomus sp.]
MHGLDGERIAVIGGGFGGLSTACYLADAGADVTVLEKNEQLGGRASRLEAEGFKFDMGPSWYLMPDVFERFF